MFRSHLDSNKTVMLVIIWCLEKIVSKVSGKYSSTSEDDFPTSGISEGNFDLSEGEHAVLSFSMLR